MTNPRRRATHFAALLALVLFAASTLPAAAQQDPAAPDPTAPAASDAPRPDAAATLPVTRVVAFTSGVGWFVHEGTVTGTEVRELQVRSEDMDDLLQSLVLQDLDGGSIRPVRYPARDPLPRILDSYALDLAGAPTLAQLLAQARGETVRIDAGEPLDGVIVSVEELHAPDEAPRSYLTLLTDQGLVRLPLAEVRDLRFQSAELRGELAAALAALAQHRDAASKTVRLRFEGEGERRVRVGYLREMPVWKTSYRLVVEDDGTADLQGWAILDNPTDTDLVDVSVSFVAGQPLSFVTELYEPVYVDRPHVEVDTAPTLAPEADAGAFPQAESRAASEAARFGALADRAMAVAPAPAAAAEPFELGGAAMAQGIAAGASFEYRVREPVTILRHASAMIPVVQATVPATRLALYDPTVLEARPLRGVRLFNDTGLHLAAGPVTVVGAAGFAGAARLGDLPDGESRILTHAVDPSLRILRQAESEPQRITAVTLQGGVLQATSLRRIRSEYRIERGGEGVPLLVLEHPRRDGYDIVRPGPAPALTADGARFGVRFADAATPGTPEARDADHDADHDADPIAPTHLRCAAGGDCTLTVVEERVESQTLRVTDLTPDRIAFFLENVDLTSDDRRTLQRIVDLQREAADLDRRIAASEAEVDRIHSEQERIRANMAALDRDASLYRRYLGELEAQEDELAAIHGDLERLRGERAELRQRLDDLIAGAA